MTLNEVTSVLPISQRCHLVTHYCFELYALMVHVLDTLVRCQNFVYRIVSTVYLIVTQMSKQQKMSNWRCYCKIHFFLCPSFNNLMTHQLPI